MIKTNCVQNLKIYQTKSQFTNHQAFHTILRLLQRRNHPPMKVTKSYNSSTDPQDMDDLDALLKEFVVKDKPQSPQPKSPPTSSISSSTPRVIPSVPPLTIAPDMPIEKLSLNTTSQSFTARRKCDGIYIGGSWLQKGYSSGTDKK
jgi:hypothetical protein